ncbi:39563_t:CDS:1, partial [Gigaspora margarita]
NLGAFYYLYLAQSLQINSAIKYIPDPKINDYALQVKLIHLNYFEN